MSEKIEIEKSSGNVFADIGLPNPEEHLLKAQLVYKIGLIMKKRKLTQAKAAKILGVKQPEVSNMLRGSFRRVSVEKLLKHLVMLGQDVEITVKPHRDTQRAARLTVTQEQERV